MTDKQEFIIDKKELLSQKSESDAEMNKKVEVEHADLFKSRTFKDELTTMQRFDDWMWYQS